VDANRLNSGFESLLKSTTVDKERRNDESTNRIPLLLSPGERNALFQLATMCRPEGEIVEIGSYKGGSTILLALATEREVYAIDPHTLACPHHRSFGDNITPEHRAEIEASMPVAQQFRYNLERAGVNSLVHEVPQTSVEAIRDWNKPISLLFIDGCHHLECVKNDFKLWSPFLINEGILVMHDVPTTHGPRRVFWDSIFISHDWSNLHLKGRLAWGIKTKSSRTNFLVNRFSLLPYLMFQVIRPMAVDFLVSRTCITNKITQSQNQSASRVDKSSRNL